MVFRCRWINWELIHARDNIVLGLQRLESISFSGGFENANARSSAMGGNGI